MRVAVVHAACCMLHVACPMLWGGCGLATCGVLRSCLGRGQTRCGGGVAGRPGGKAKHSTAPRTAGQLPTHPAVRLPTPPTANRQAVLDNVEADFTIVNSMMDVVNAEAARLASEHGLPQLLPEEGGSGLGLGGGGGAAGGAALPVRLSQRMEGVRALLQRMTEELLVADAERR